VKTLGIVLSHQWLYSFFLATVTLLSFLLCSSASFTFSASSTFRCTRKLLLVNERLIPLSVWIHVILETSHILLAINLVTLRQINHVNHEDSCNHLLPLDASTLPYMCLTKDFCLPAPHPNRRLFSTIPKWQQSNTRPLS
jgi:hypothetical protein